MKIIKLLISLLILFVPTIYFGIMKNSIAMGIILIPCIIAVLLINMQYLKENLTSIKAKDLEIQFKNAINEAYATIEQLKDMQCILTEVSTETIYRGKFWGGMSIENQISIFNKLYENASANKNKKAINEPLKIAYQRLLGEAFGRITEGINDNIIKKQLSDKLESIYSFKGNTNIFLDGKYIPSPIAIENYITSTVQCDSILQKINNNIVLYKEILKEYQNKFENIELQGEIS